MEKFFKRRIPQNLFIVIGLFMIIGLSPQKAMASETYTVTDRETLNIETGLLTKADNTTQTLTISNGDAIEVAEGSTVTLTGSKNIPITCGESVTLTLDSVTNDFDKTAAAPETCPLVFSGSGNTLILSGTNTLKAGINSPGIRVEAGYYYLGIADTKLEIKGDGSLDVTGGEYCAGIGGGGNNTCGGTITISGGMVTANGGKEGAGIGGAKNGGGGTITITDGKVIASGGQGTITGTGGQDGAGIGGGNGGDSGKITILGGTVTATGSDYSAGIGGGKDGNCDTISIKGGMVFAKGGIYSSDIGPGSPFGGYWSDQLSISGDALVFVANDNCLTPETSTHEHFPSTDPLYGFSLPDGWSDAGIYALAYSLTYDGGSTGTIIENVPQDRTTRIEDSSIFEIPGYTLEWNTEADGSGTGYAPGDGLTLMEDITLYAIWTLETAKMVDSISPADSDAAVDGNVVITFYYKMDTTVTGTVTINGTVLSGGGWSNGNRTYTIPYSGLAYYTDYTIDISGFKDTKYITMKAASASFSTKATADLLSLAVNTGSLIPAFDPDTTVYRVDVSDIDSIGITARTLDPEAVLTTNGAEATSGTEVTVNLNNGANLIPFVVTAQDGSQKAYVVSIKKAADDADLIINANLASLSLNVGYLSPVFNPEITTYYTSVGSDVDTIELTAAASDTKAVMLLNGALLSQGSSQTIPLSPGDNEVELMVVAQDASTQSYKLTINREDSEEITCTYQTHVENIGWQGFVSNGEISGTQGQSLRLEGIEIELEDQENIDVEYSTHIENIGWQDFVADGEMSGTQGQALRLEAIKINLTGDDADRYDIYYQVHVQNFGWLNWAKNGEEAGTAGFGWRLEAIRIVVVPKGEVAPGDTQITFIES
ncbi:cadherin-like beta sandwich domain-containing protein [Eubacteriaceae bacterium ES2]|nr:cadherin-like beta sandwich domain-containing protein [Eubacteriaceae bacterium ES2]